MISKKAREQIDKLFKSKTYKLDKDYLDKDEILKARVEIDKELGNLPLGKNTKQVKVESGYLFEYCGEDKNLNKIIIFLHGGAWCNGTVISRRFPASNLASYCKMDCLSLDYPQWPETFHPSALEMIYQEYQKLINKGYKSKDIVLFGESAGASLAISFTLYLKDKNEELPNKICVFSPPASIRIDEKDIVSRVERFNRDPMLGADIYLGFPYFEEKDYVNPLCSLKYASYKDFPPTLLNVGSEEMLYDDVNIIYDLMKKDGVDVTLKVWDDLFHCFLMYDIDESYCFFEYAAKFINS